MEPKIDSHYGSLDEILKLTKENNQMLHSMRRAQKWATVMRIVYWLIIIGISVGAYIYVQPYVNKLLSLYNQNQSVFADLKNFSSGSQIQSLINQVKGGVK